MGSAPDWLLQVSRPVGHPDAGLASAGLINVVLVTKPHKTDFQYVRIRDVVARARAATLEGVVETEPVANL